MQLAVLIFAMAERGQARDEDVFKTRPGRKN
jgi:hypothetical protein